MLCRIAARHGCGNRTPFWRRTARLYLSSPRERVISSYSRHVGGPLPARPEPWQSTGEARAVASTHVPEAVSPERDRVRFDDVSTRAGR